MRWQNILLIGASFDNDELDHKSDCNGQIWRYALDLKGSRSIIKDEKLIRHFMFVFCVYELKSLLLSVSGGEWFLVS